MLLESILDDIAVTDRQTSIQTIAESSAKYNNSIWLMRDTQIISVFRLNTSEKTKEENKEIIREICYDLTEDVFDTLERLLDATPLIKNGYKISFVHLDDLPYKDGKIIDIEKHIIEEYDQDEWMKICTDWWTQYDIYATPVVAIRIQCNINHVSFNTFRREYCLFYRKTVNSSRMLLRSAIVVTDDATSETLMQLTIEDRLPKELIDGYVNMFNDQESTNDPKPDHHKNRSQRKARDIQNFVRYLIWLEKQTKTNPEENLLFQMDGMEHKWGQFTAENAYQFIIKLTPKDGAYYVDDAKRFIKTKFLKGIEQYGFHPTDNSNTIEFYILDGGAFMTDDMKKNPMELGTVEVDGHMLTLFLGFLTEDYYKYPCGRTKKYHKLEDAHTMWQNWMSCRSGRNTFF